jgi:Transport and Golgi organisation 2
MCTISFVPGEDGYLVAMNRDELRTRPPALPPRILEINGLEVIYPRERAGGTWIACNAAGNVFALLNWDNADRALPSAKRQTRGAIIPRLIAETDSSAFGSRLEDLDLNRMNAFRLVGILRDGRRVREWRWDGVRLKDADFAWARQHWFSSSLSDALAEENRGQACESAARESTALDEEWLAKLHRSHEPGPGPYSICVHRPDATTASFTVVRFSCKSVSMGYLEGSPCRKNGLDWLSTIAVRRA